MNQEVIVDYAKFGLRVRQARQERKLTQQKLSEMASLSPNYVGAIERAEGVPSIETLVRLANALRMPIQYFLADSLIPIEMDDCVKEAMEVFMSMPPKAQRFAIENMRLCKNFCDNTLENIFV